MAGTETTLAVPAVAGPSIQGNVDVAQLTNASGTTVLRENVVVADPVNFGLQAGVSSRGMLIDDQLRGIFQEILVELRVISALLQQGLTLPGEDLDAMRTDPYFAQRLEQ